MGELPARQHSEDDLYATLEEARDAIAALQPTDLAKLAYIARYFVRGRLQSTGDEPADLLHDAIAKTLQGTRKWNKRVSIVKHLDRVMESDSSHIAERTSKWPPVPLPPDGGELSTHLPNPDERLVADEELDALLRGFEDDNIALEIIHLKHDGYSASEIQEKLGIARTEYESATRRIRRRFVLHLRKKGGN